MHTQCNRDPHIKLTTYIQRRISVSLSIYWPLLQKYFRLTYNLSHLRVFSYNHVYKDNERNANNDLLADLDIANT